MPVLLPRSNQTCGDKEALAMSFLNYFYKKRSIFAKSYDFDQENEENQGERERAKGEAETGPAEKLAVGCFSPTDLYHEFELINDVEHVTYTQFKQVVNVACYSSFVFLSSSHPFSHTISSNLFLLFFPLSFYFFRLS